MKIVEEGRKEIEQEFKWFLKQYNLKLKKTTQYGVIYVNKHFELNFIYEVSHRYAPLMFVDVVIDGCNFDTNFRSIINLMGKLREEKWIDTYEILTFGSFNNYSKYFKSHLIPFFDLLKDECEILKVSFHDSMVVWGDNKYYIQEKEFSLGKALIHFNSFRNMDRNFFKIFLKDGTEICITAIENKKRWLIESYVNNIYNAHISDKLIDDKECLELIIQCYQRESRILF